MTLEPLLTRPAQTPPRGGALHGTGYMYCSWPEGVSCEEKEGKHRHRGCEGKEGVHIERVEGGEIY